MEGFRNILKRGIFMEPIMRVVQTAQGSKEFWKELDPHELRDYYSFRMDTVVVDSSQEFQTHKGFGGACRIGK